MTWLQVLVSRLIGLFRKGSRDCELDEELCSHLEMLVEENLRKGMSPKEARYAASRSFGGVEQAKESYRQQRGLPMIETVVQDIRYGLRMLAKNAGLAAGKVLSSTFQGGGTMYQLMVQNVKRAVLLGLGVLAAEICGMAAVPSGFGPTPIFSEEFTGSSLNTTIWTYRAEGKLRKYCYVDSSAVAVANGYARISIYTANNSHGVPTNYCGAIDTQSGTFLNTYGYWEASVRFHYQPGMQCAFWVQSRSIGSITNNPQQSGVEMDVFEHIQSAGRTSYNHAVWWNSGAYTKGTYHLGTQSNLDDGNFHTFGLAWTPGSLTFYVDGVQTWHLSASEVAISNIAEYIILDTELPSAKGVPTEGYGPLRSSSNAYLDVDYVRVYPYRMKTTSITLGAVEDTYVRDGKAETANFFCSPTLFVKKDATGYNRNSYLKFDLSHITAPVLQATLYLTPTVIEENNVTTIARYAPVNSWTADSITWKNQPVTSVQLSTGTNYAVGTLTNFDVTAVATAGQAFSVQIAADTASGSPTSVVGYGSQENSAPAYRPQLVIITTVD